MIEVYLDWLLEAVLTQLGHADLVLCFRKDLKINGSHAEVSIVGRPPVYVSSARNFGPELYQAPG